jgi:chromosome segregation ATPase
LDALEYENARLRAAAESAPPVVQPPTETEAKPVEEAPPPPPPQEDNAELDQLKGKHEEALQKISLLEKELEESKALQATKETEIGALKQDLEKSGKEREEEKLSDTAAIASLRTELENVSKESQNLQKVCEEREALLAELEGNLQAKEGEVQSLKDSLASTTLELEEERKELGLQIEELRTAGQVGLVYFFVLFLC